MTYFEGFIGLIALGEMFAGAFIFGLLITALVRKK